MQLMLMLLITLTHLLLGLLLFIHFIIFVPVNEIIFIVLFVAELPLLVILNVKHVINAKLHPDVFII